VKVATRPTTREKTMKRGTYSVIVFPAPIQNTKKGTIQQNGSRKEAATNLT
jgi:hypothetical protein